MEKLPVVDYEDLFRDALEQVREGARLVTDGFHTLVATVNRAIEMFDRGSVFAPWSKGVVLWLQHGLDQIRTHVQEAIEIVDRVLERSTPVLSLVVMSFSWVTRVQTPLSDLASTMTSPRDQNLYHWSGAAASIYHDKAGVQRAAVEQSSSNAAFISEWLCGIVESNVDYMVALVEMLTSLARKLTAAAGEAAGVVTAPWAVQQASEVTSGIITDLLDVLVMIGQQFVEVVGNIRDLESQSGDHSALPGGQWPQAIAG